MTISKKEFNAKNGILAGTINDNFIQLTGDTTGNSPTILSQGLDDNIDLKIVAKGNGIIVLGEGDNSGITYVDSKNWANGVYQISIKSASGNRTESVMIAH